MKERTFTLFITYAMGYEPQAKGEIIKILEGYDFSVDRFVMRGLFKVRIRNLNENGSELMQKFSESKTNYLSQVFPIQKIVQIPPDIRAIELLQRPFLNLPPPPKGARFMVTCKRRGTHPYSSQEICRNLGALAVENWDVKVDLKNPQWIGIVEIAQSHAALSILQPSEIIKKKQDFTPRMPKKDRPINKAYFKLKEAFDEFDILPEKAWTVLDVGSSPGGWTMFLSPLVKKVVAVDPGVMAAQAIEMPNVTHYKDKVENLDLKKHLPFHMVVNDMNIHPKESARIMVDLADLLEPGTPCIMSIKYVSRRKEGLLNRAKETLGQSFKDIKVRRMKYNSMETTLFCIRK